MLSCLVTVYILVIQFIIILQQYIDTTDSQNVSFATEKHIQLCTFIHNRINYKFYFYMRLNELNSIGWLPFLHYIISRIQLHSQDFYRIVKYNKTTLFSNIRTSYKSNSTNKGKLLCFCINNNNHNIIG